MVENIENRFRELEDRYDQLSTSLLASELFNKIVFQFLLSKYTDDLSGFEVDFNFARKAIIDRFETEPENAFLAEGYEEMFTKVEQLFKSLSKKEK